MAAEVSVDDELSDDVRALRPLIELAATGRITPQQGEALVIRFDALGSKANANASAKRLARAIEKRGNTQHIRELARTVLGLTG